MAFFKKPIGQIQPPTPKEKPVNDNCRIKYKRDKTGKVREIEFGGNCTKQQIEIAKEQLEINGSDEE